MDDSPRRKRHGGRAGNARRSDHFHLDQMGWRIAENTDRPTEPLADEGVQAIHDTAMRVLEEIGIEFLNDEALAPVPPDRGEGRGHQRADGPRLRDGDGAPGAAELHHHPAQPRPPDHHRRHAHGVRQRLVAAELFRPRDRQGARAPASIAPTCCRLTQAFNCIHVAGGYPVEPVDIHPSVRHLDVLFDKLTLTDKVCPCLFAGHGAGRGRDGDGAHRRRAERGGVPGDAADVHQHQLDLALEARHADDRRLPALRAARPGDGGDAVHAGRRDGAGDHGRRGGAVDRRGARASSRWRNGCGPARPAPSAPSPRTST